MGVGIMIVTECSPTTKTAEWRGGGDRGIKLFAMELDSLFT